MQKHAAPICAALLLLLPVLYVGSYLALVDPNSIRVRGGILESTNYRTGGGFAACLYWPLEQIDQKVRPGAWVRPAIQSSKFPPKIPARRSP